MQSQRHPCKEVHLNLAYRWLCRLGLEGDTLDHSTFFKNRHGRFRDCYLLYELGISSGSCFVEEAPADFRRRSCCLKDQ